VSKRAYGTSTNRFAVLLAGAFSLDKHFQPYWVVGWLSRV